MNVFLLVIKIQLELILFLPLGGFFLQRRQTLHLVPKKTGSVLFLNVGFVIVSFTSFQLRRLHEEGVQLVRIALEEEGLGGILV